MCDFSLAEAGFLGKKSAEIKEAEFEEMWKAAKGDEYLQRHASKISSNYLQRKHGIAKSTQSGGTKAAALRKSTEVRGKKH